MELGVLRVGEESVRPPDRGEHLCANTQLLVVEMRESQSVVLPVLPEVEVDSVILKTQNETNINLIYYNHTFHTSKHIHFIFVINF